MRSAREVILAWVDAFNRRDAEAAALYHDDATNLQVAVGQPLVGRTAIHEDLRTFFGAFPDTFTKMEGLLEDGEWVALEWSGGGTWRGEFRRPTRQRSRFHTPRIGLLPCGAGEDQVPARLLGQGDLVRPARTADRLGARVWQRQQGIEAMARVVTALPTVRVLRLGEDNLAAPYIVEQAKEVIP